MLGIFSWGPPGPDAPSLGEWMQLAVGLVVIFALVYLGVRNSD